MWRRLALALLLAGCHGAGPETREMNLYPTPDFKATESSRYYYTALAHYKAHEYDETKIFSKLSLDMFEQEKAEPRQIRLARQLYADALSESGDRAGARLVFSRLHQDYPEVPSYKAGAGVP